MAGAGVDRVFERRLAAIVNSHEARLLAGGQRGLERETLRVTPEAQIAPSPHPAALGAPLTNAHITTDYSEALTELVTPPFENSAELLRYLEALHQFVYPRIGDELLWGASMPCALAGDTAVPIAQYGSSFQGQIKSIYRHGLLVRYGGMMQAISGVHFNYSLPSAFWPLFAEIGKAAATTKWEVARAAGPQGPSAAALRDFISDRYFGLLRNYRRYGWIVDYLFGASPALDSSFLQGRPEPGLEPMTAATVIGRHATSLRMSDLGYRNRNQSEVAVSVNSLQEYLADLLREVHELNPQFAALGLKRDGRYQQLSVNTLQIENEYYSYIRPKRTLRPGERTLHALARGGVEYVEVRALDNNPFEPTGVEPQSLLFLEAFVQWLLLKDGALIAPAEAAAIEENHLRVTRRGREPGLTLERDGRSVLMSAWATEVLDSMQGICEQLDNAATGEARDTGAGAGRAYSATLAVQRIKLADPAQTPSARLLHELDERGESFSDLALRHSRQHRSRLLSQPSDASLEAVFAAQAAESLREREAIERAQRGSFEEYLARYLAD